MLSDANMLSGNPGRTLLHGFVVVCGLSCNNESSRSMLRYWLIRRGSCNGAHLYTVRAGFFYSTPKLKYMTIP